MFTRLNKNLHQRAGKYTNNGTDRQAEYQGNSGCAADSEANPAGLPSAIVLGYKGRKGVSKILNRHIGEGVDFYCCGKGGHDGGAKLIDQPLHHQNAKIHNRLLRAGKKGKTGQFPDQCRVPVHVPSAEPQFRKTRQGIEGEADTG